MDIEGTRHEKAVLVVISFIIGFTCGLIAFGLRPSTTTEMVSEPTVELMMPPVDMAAPAVIEGYEPPTENPPDYTPAEDEVVPATTEPVTYEDGKLYANVGDERFLLSLRTDIMTDPNVEGFATQGLHEALPVYSASPDGQFVHFCEQQTTEPECTHFVFSVADTAIHFVSNNGEKVTTPVDQALNSYWSEAGLVVDTLTSASPVTPWEMATNNVETATVDEMPAGM